MTNCADTFRSAQSVSSPYEDYSLMTWDPAPPPRGSESAAVIFHDVDAVYEVYLPGVAR